VDTTEGFEYIPLRDLHVLPCGLLGEVDRRAVDDHVRALHGPENLDDLGIGIQSPHGGLAATARNSDE
jgi:hypothetical protein